MISILPHSQTDVTIEVQVAQAWVCQGPDGGKTTSLSVSRAGVDLAKLRPEAGDGWLVALDNVLAPDGEIVCDVLRADDQVHVLPVLVPHCDGHQDTAQTHQHGGVTTSKLEPHAELMFAAWRAWSRHSVRGLLLPPH